MRLQNVLHAIDLLNQDVSNDDEWARLSEERKFAVATHVYDPGKSDCSHQHEPLGQDLPVVTFDDIEREQEEEEEPCKWQTFFLMENHRKYGMRLPLTEKLLELHNAGHLEG